MFYISKKYIMNRREFVENFDYTLFDDYLDENISILNSLSNTITNYFKYYDGLFKILYKNNIVEHCFEVYDLKLNPGFLFKDDNCLNIYHHNCLMLEFPRLYPSIYSNYYLNNESDYNENVFLMYALLNNYRIHIKKNRPELNYISRCLLNAYYGFIITKKFLKDHIPYTYIKNLSSKLSNVMYIDTDMFWFKDISEEKLMDMCKNIDIPFEISPIKYVYLENYKRYGIFLKNKDTNQYNSIIKGIRDKDYSIKIEKEFKLLWRLEICEKVLEL